MGELSSGEMIGTRVRFQRFSDSKIFHGWFQGFTTESFLVHAQVTTPLVIGDRFFFQVAAMDSDVRFIGDFLTVGPSDKARNLGDRLPSEIEEDERELQFKLTGQIQFRPLTEEPRRRVGDRIVTIAEGSGAEVPALLSDVSPSGAGILCGKQFQKGQIIRLHLESLQRQSSFEAEVRYCVRSRGVPDMFKAGLKFREFGRVEEALWKSMLRQAA